MDPPTQTPGRTPGRVRFTEPSPASTSNASLASGTSASTDLDTSSSLQFLATQLQSHGFLPPASSLSPLLSLPGTVQVELEKCLTGLLQQRVQDMERLEEVGGRLRAVEWEVGRRVRMWEEEREGRGRAERGWEGERARVGALAKSLQSEQSSHRSTHTLLTRTQSSLQTVRSHAQAELRKRDKEVEKITERWQRVAGEQARLGALGSGMRGEVLGASEVRVEGDPLLETALQETESQRSRLVEENEAFRSCLLSVAHALQALAKPGEPPMLASALFTPGLILGEGGEWQANNARSTLLSLCSELRPRLSSLPTSPSNSGSPGVPAQPVSAIAEELETAKDEIQRLAGNVQRLEDELAESRLREEKGQRLMEGWAMQATRGRVSDVFPDSPQASRKQALDEAAHKLEADRAQLTEAAVQLGKERAALQRERAALEEERRRAALRQMLDDLPSTPVGGGLPTSTPAAGFAKLHYSALEEVEEPHEHRTAQADPEDLPELRTPTPPRRKLAHKPRRSQSPSSHAHKHKPKRTSLGGSKSTATHGHPRKGAVFPRKSALKAVQQAQDYRPVVGSPLKVVTTFADSSASSRADSEGEGKAALSGLGRSKGKEREKENAPLIPEPTPIPGQPFRSSQAGGKLRASAQLEKARLRASRTSQGQGVGGGRDSLRLSTRDLLPVDGGRRKSVLGGGAQRVWRG